MKKNLYFALLAAETLVGLALLVFVWLKLGAALCLIVAAVWVLMAGTLIRRIQKSNDEAANRKTRIKLALVMLIPTLVAALALIAYFSLLSMYT